MRFFSRQVTFNYILRHLRRLLFRKTVIYERRSAIAGSIVVFDCGWERVLSIGGETHSVYYKFWGWGEARRDYWGLLATPVFGNVGGANILMLGLGGGTTLHLLYLRYFRYLRQHRPAPGHVTVVEHDPEIISAAKKYFDLESITRVEVIPGDAMAEMRRMRDQRVTFDMLIDDVFFNMRSVDTDAGKEIYDTMKGLVRPGGSIILNRPIDRPQDADRNARFIAQLQTLGNEVALRTVRESGWNDIIYFRTREP